MTAHPSSPDLPRLILGIICILLLLTASFWVLKPFLLPLVWATMIAVSTWPMLLAVERGFGGRRSPAAALLTLALLVVVIAPLTLAVMTIVQNIDLIKRLVGELAADGLPPLPAWVAGLPMVGERAAAWWGELAGGAAGPSAQLVGYINKALAWFVNSAGGVGLLLLQLLLTVVLTAILYLKGEAAEAGVRRFFARLAGERGEQAVILAGRSIRAVAMGIVVTAAIQSLLGGLGLWAAGVPAPALWTAVMFLLAVAQVGAAPVLAVAAGWLFWQGGTGWGVTMLVWVVVVGSLDNVVRPVLIRKGADLPMLLIFAGVLGGLVAFGIIGLFVGPVVLAVSYTLIGQWMAGQPPGTVAGSGEGRS